jgi:lipid II:glycine glycyltransferase (peptidoglycan interpeptide bridge formation enzyme)
VSAASGAAPSAETIVVRSATDADRPAWDAFVAARPEGDPLQLWAWGDVRAAEGEPPLRLVATRSDGRIAGLAGILVRPTSFGRTVMYAPHGPLWTRDAADGPAVLAALVEGLRAAARQRRAIVVKVDPRSAAPGDETALEASLLALGLARAEADLQARTTRLVALLDGGDALMATWDKDERNRVRRSAREGVVTEVDRAGDPAVIAAFHEVHRETASRGGFAIHSTDFLAGLAAALSPAGGWLLVVARLGDRPIAGVVMARVGDRAYYLYGASLRDHELRHAFGSDAAMAMAMATLAADGVRELDLWGVAEPDDPDADAEWAGFSMFKRRFGGERLRHPGAFDLVTDRPFFALRAARSRAATAVRRLRAGRGGGTEPARADSREPSGG